MMVSFKTNPDDSLIQRSSTPVNIGASLRGSYFMNTIISNWLPNAGFGYRFEVQPRMNVRAEIGFGRESAGFYFSFNEAF